MLHDTLFVRTLISLTTLLLFNACTTPILGSGRLSHHVLTIDEDGALLDSATPEGCANTAQLCSQEITRLTRADEKIKFTDKINQLSQFSPDARNAFCIGHGYSSPSPALNKIIIFVHGGLNGHSQSISRSARLLPKIICEDGLYPFFIHWQSSLESSYAEHLLNIRQGKHFEFYMPQALGFVLPVLITDAARGLARSPLALSHLIESDWHGSVFHDDVEDRAVANDLILLNGSSPQDTQITVSTPQPNPPWTWKTWYSGFTYLVTLPTKILIAPFLDAFGTSAWNNMLRRTHILFDRDDQFDFGSELTKDRIIGAQEKLRQRGHQPIGFEGLSSLKPRGILALFTDQLVTSLNLQNQQNQQSGKPPYQVILVGHSAGTIVLNQWLREYGPELNGLVDSIVYMAAATSIRDYQESVWPFLERSQHTKFYNLMLHEKAEAQDNWILPIPIVEQLMIDPGPRGSLLVWIDGFLGNPLTTVDRTLGRYTNLMATIHNTPTSIRGRIFLKVFPIGVDNQPQKHGDFSDPFRFWRSLCWNPNQDNPSDCWTN